MTSRLKMDLLLFALMPPRLIYSILIEIYKIYISKSPDMCYKEFDRDDKIVPKILPERGVEKLGLSSQD